jgi:hypothetical protein
MKLSLRLPRQERSQWIIMMIHQDVGGVVVPF